jgi:CheY-like chemotaxis protein
MCIKEACLEQAKEQFILLIAEDDEEDRSMLEEASREAGITLPIHCVENGEELFDFLNRRNKFTDIEEILKPLLILLDLNMPKLDGRQALEELKKEDRFREIPVIVFTTSNTRNEISRAYQSGASSFIIKPFSFKTLVDMMKVIKHYWLETVELP